MTVKVDGITIECEYTEKCLEWDESRTCCLECAHNKYGKASYFVKKEPTIEPPPLPTDGFGEYIERGFAL